MDEYDFLLQEINREKKAKEEKKFWRGKKWTKEQLRKLEAQEKLRLELNRIKSGQEIQREMMREQMGLTDTKGLTILKENIEKLLSDLKNSRPLKSGVILDGVFYEDFSHFCSALINKYFIKEEEENI